MPTPAEEVAVQGKLLTLLTDYGYDDEFAGVCRTVIAGLAPAVELVDLTHGIPAGDVRRGALALEAAVGVAPEAVHLAVVDPGVGTGRRALALAVRSGGFLVGPDNGLLGLAAARLGGVTAAYDASASPLRREPVAPTFHGRDIFAPVAAHLAAGRPAEAVGEPGDPASLVVLELPVPRVAERHAVVHVLYADRFGNLILDARTGDLAPLLGVPPGQGPGTGAPLVHVASAAGRFSAAPGLTFADAGDEDLVLYEDSSGRLGLAVHRHSAAELLGAGRDDELTITPAP